MKPGRELDALVAEHVMGWKRAVQPHPELPEITLYDLYNSHVPMPHYSTDIAAAWLVVEKLTSDGIPLVLGNTTNREKDSQAKFAVTIFENWIGHVIPEDIRHVSAQAETAPHAICLAALKAIGFELDK